MLCSKSGSQCILDKQVCYIPLNFNQHVIVEEWLSYCVATAYHISEWQLGHCPQLLSAASHQFIRRRSFRIIETPRLLFVTCLCCLSLQRHFVRKNTLTPVAAVHILSIFYSARLVSSVICLLHYFILNGYPIASRGKEIAVRKVLNILHISHSELLVCLVVVCFHSVYNCDLCLYCCIPQETLNATFFFVSRTTSQVFVSWVILLDTKMPIYDIVWPISSSNRKLHVLVLRCTFKERPDAAYRIRYHYHVVTLSLI